MRCPVCHKRNYLYIQAPASCLVKPRRIVKKLDEGITVKVNMEIFVNNDNFIICTKCGHIFPLRIALSEEANKNVHV